LKVDSVKLNLSRAVFPLSLVISGAALAQTPPGAGTLSRQLEREQPPRPANAAPEIRVEQGGAAPSTVADQQKILVNRLHVTGAKIYSEPTLLALTGFAGPRELTLSALRAMAAKITAHYRAHGYFLAQAYLPAQEIRNGEVTITVLEGQYGKVSLRNQSKLSDDVAHSVADGLESGDAIEIAPLERRILLLSDIPGVNVKSTLVPGASVGASDLIIDVTPGQRFTGSIDADNQGNRYTGADRLGATANINNLSGHGDVLSARALTSGSGLHYGRAAYQTQLGVAQAGLAYASMTYRLGSDFEALHAHGSVDIASLYGSYPLIRSRSNNLTLQLDLDAKTFRDQVDATATLADRKAHAAMLSLNGNSRDDLGGGGVNTYALTWTTGSIDIESAGALATDAATVRSNGRYDKLSVQAMRLQSVTEATSLYAAVTAQLASKNLDTSEKMGLGGASAVRAYPAGEAYGDQAYVLNLEARTWLPKLSQHLPGQMQLVGFIDTGSVQLNKNAFAAGQNRRTLSGAGIGLNWVGDASFVVKAYLAHKLGNAAATSAPDAQTRFWLQAVKFF
jgi:hemolysin activation/secretion protein